MKNTVVLTFDDNSKHITKFTSLDSEFTQPKLMRMYPLGSNYFGKKIKSVTIFKTIDHEIKS